ncbi:hypothetical protein BGX21_004584 [Mortierella sp. AD011]|nr:hypothetical protein BGX20_005688 [Mortierella sp. AD010]KAF9400297.1 hypothetical protein BGX21_004584 [Mortierella sp. AD011]
MIDNCISLLCVTDGTSNAFSVKIHSTDTFDDLKKLIKAQRAPRFDKFAADELVLYRVCIPFALAAKGNAIILGKTPSAIEPTKLDLTGDISDVFKETPSKKMIQIIVQASLEQSVRESYLHNQQQVFREYLERAKYAGTKELHISLECPTKKFSSYTWKKIEAQYGIEGTPGFLEVFDIQPKSLNENEKAVLNRIVQGCTEHNRVYMFDSGASEATRSTIVNLFMVGAMLFHDSTMVLAQQQQMKGLRGRGSIDFAVIDRKRRTQVLGVTGVKKDNHNQGLAQNMVQLDVAVQQKKRKRVEEIDMESGERPRIRTKSYGIVTDAFKWTLVECILDKKNTLTFRAKEIPQYLQMKLGEKELRDSCEIIFGYVLALFDLVKDEMINTGAYSNSSSSSNINKRIATDSARIK